MKKLISLALLTSLTFSELTFSENLEETLFDKLRPKEPQTPECIYYQRLCKDITYLHGNHIMVAEVTINDQVFLGWRPPCDPYCGSMNVEFTMAAEALEEQVKSLFPDARLEETYPKY